MLNTLPKSCTKKTSECREVKQNTTKTKQILPMITEENAKHFNQPRAKVEKVK